jgi:hypothetical protein
MQPAYHDREALRSPAVQLVVEPPLVAFVDDDAGYLAWVAANPDRLRGEHDPLAPT